MSDKQNNSISDKRKRQDIQFAQKDEALRDDVHALGEMIGEMLVEQGGEALYKSVESARRLAIGRRAGNVDDREKLDKMLSKMSTSAARDVARAFSTYFQIVNTAEQVHRIRRRRDYLKDSESRQSRSLDATVFQLRDAGFGLDAVAGLLEKIELESVFTPHPTEITRRTILRKQQHIVRRMMDLQNTSLTPLERDTCMQNIRSEITAIWQTEDIPSEGTTVFDALEHMLFFLTDVIYRVIPPFYEQLNRALSDAYGETAKSLALPNMLSFASWIGGDVSAGKEMSARVVRDTLHRHRSLIVDLYYRDCGVLAEKLSQSISRIDVDDEIFERIDQYSRQFPEHRGAIPARYRNMPYRLLFRLIAERLQATYYDAAFPYESAEEFIDDLNLIANSLARRKGANAGLTSVRKLARQAETFGFHFLSLDIRQNASNIQRAVGFCLNDESWISASKQYRIGKLRDVLANNASPIVEPDNDTKRLMAVFQAISYCRRRFGSKSIGVFLVRHCQGIDDVLATLLLARWAELTDSDGSVALDVAPEFDTNQELSQSAELLSDLLSDPFYQANLAARDSRQTVMLSNSDSAKENSMATSRWRMQQAHSQLNSIFANADINYTLFHGRGSLSGRSGAADGIACGHLRVTEHGEATNDRYGIQGIALRTLEKSFSMVATATANLDNRPARDAESTNIMEHIATDCDRVYKELIHDKVDFDQYFRDATPIDVIELTRVSAHSNQNVTDINSADDGLPWAFAWAQSRFLLPQWYGAGSGLRSAIQMFGLDTLQKMTDNWQFFNKLLNDVEISLAIADMDIAELYSRLADEELHDHFFPVIQAEYDKTVNVVLELRQQKILLEKSGTLSRSIVLRNPYVDPMSLLQIELLQRWRAGDKQDSKLRTALLASISGISRGLQTSS